MLHELFQGGLTKNFPLAMAPKYFRLKNTITENINKAITHYRTNDYAVRSNHILVKVLQDIPGLSSNDILNYHRKLCDDYYSVASAEGMTNLIGYGKINKRSFFYNDEVDEIIIGTSSTLKKKDLKNWTDLQPIKVHLHPYDGLNYNAPNNKNYNAIKTRGLAVISIDIPMLAVQFAMWDRLVRSEMERQGMAIPSMVHFISKYPIANMLYSHNDQVIINRYINTYFNNIKGDGKRKTPFWTTEAEPLLDEVIAQQLKTTDKVHRFYEASLLHIPTVSNNGYDAVNLPIDFDTRQTRWAWMTTRLKIVNFLLSLDSTFGKSKNYEIINGLKMLLTRINSDRTFNLKTTDNIREYHVKYLSSINSLLTNF